MITATLDTNVLASGIVTFQKPIPPARILKAWRAGEFQLFTSEHILKELQRTLAKAYFQQYITSQQVKGVISLFREEAIVVPITKIVIGVAASPEDDLAIATALSAKSDYLVTGDKPFLNKVGRSYQGVKICNPSDFIKELYIL